MATIELLSQRLELVFQWYQGMVNDQTGLFEYLYRPESDTFVREQSPIRDIATIWDASLVAAFLKRDDLRPVIERSLEKYSSYLVEHHGSLIVDPRRLAEPSSIAHSAFAILALLHSPASKRDDEIKALAEGIRRQQRPDGSYQVYFDHLPDAGEELYAGEAMVALLETHRALGEPRLLESATRAFEYYDAGYFRRERVTDAMLVFFANWQSQACRLLVESPERPAPATRVADYMYAMHDRIIQLGFFDAVVRHPARQVSVEVACAVEGLCDAYAVALALRDPHADAYRAATCTGLQYLLDLQCTQSRSSREVGGFGMSQGDRTQRIDVTGHAASGFLKSIAAGVSCPAR